MRYIPHTPEDISHMLKVVGFDDVEALFDTVPEALQLGRPLNIPSGLSERDLLKHMASLAAKNHHGEEGVSFLGGGVYRHYRPIAMDHLLLRGELYTAYTPYQPEASQGTLQIIFEFQTLIAELLGVDVVNASMYDGATSVAEAALMAARVTRRETIVVSETVHPEYREVVKGYTESSDLTLVSVPGTSDGVADLDAIRAVVDGRTAGVIVGYPNFFGRPDDVAGAAEIAHDAGAQLIAAFQEAFAFGLMTPPGALGADIVAGEGQSLGVPPSYGGPHLGLFGCRQKQVRKMPGRLAGQTVDNRGQRGFVLTMSTREQHIRREKATSNICTNQGLMATASTIYMAMLGPDGLAKVARASHLRSEQTKRAVCALEGFSARYEGATFNEFVVNTPRPAADIVRELAAKGVAPGIALGHLGDGWANALLITATELTTDEDISTLCDALQGN
ncbi:MAG: aminomethyl-transferring glycine dehydrogenase subunit GcvPA [Myxococcota bacterium]